MVGVTAESGDPGATEQFREFKSPSCELNFLPYAVRSVATYGLSCVSPGLCVVSSNQNADKSRINEEILLSKM